jgi:hypothetical protein
VPFREFTQLNLIHLLSLITKQIGFNLESEVRELYRRIRVSETSLPSLRLSVRYHSDSITNINIVY